MAPALINHGFMSTAAGVGFLLLRIKSESFLWSWIEI